MATIQRKIDFWKKLIGNEKGRDCVRKRERGKRERKKWERLKTLFQKRTTEKDEKNEKGERRKESE